MWYGIQRCDSGAMSFEKANAANLVKTGCEFFNNIGEEK